jgi:hypothetical protein
MQPEVANAHNVQVRGFALPLRHREEIQMAGTIYGGAGIPRSGIRLMRTEGFRLCGHDVFKLRSMEV